MEHLPPIGWADVATRRDLELLEQRIEVRILQVFNRQTLQLLGFFTALTGVFVATVKI